MSDELAPTAVAVLEHIVRSIVDDPDTAASIRTVTRAAASKDDVDIDIEFLD